MSTDGETPHATAARRHSRTRHGHSVARARLRRARAARGGRHLRHDPARRQPAGGPVAHRRRQAPGGRAARPPRRHLHRGRLARRQPQGHRVLRPGQEGARPRHRDAGRLRLDPPGRRQARRTTRCWPSSSRPARRWPASWPSRGTATSPRRCGPRSTRRSPWWPTRCATCASTTCASSSMPSTSSTATATTPTSPCGPGRGRGGRRRGARAVRHQRRLAARRRRPGRGRRARPDQRPARHPLPQRRRLRRGQLARRRAGGGDPGPGLHQRLRRAGGQHRPLGRHPQPVAEAQHPHHPAPSAWSA